MHRSLRALSLLSISLGIFILPPSYGQAAGPVRASSAKRTVCTITTNSSEEKNAFAAKLSKENFEFKELTDIGRTSSSDANPHWFQRACESKIQCDVLIVSGHFAGSFFGNSKEEWSLDDMEKMSCSNKCNGIMKNPKETFLFGCNTLATKEKDHRDPAAYTLLLQDPHNQLSEAAATRVSQARYSALGASFRERMQRAFAGVPHLYGFDSVGPLGAAVKPSLDAYLNQIPSYGAYLDRIKKTEGERIGELAIAVNGAVGNINETVMNGPNRKLAQELSEFNFAQCTGVMPATKEDAIREAICRLHNRDLPLADRAQQAADMLRQQDRLAYLPSVFEFLKENEQELQRDPRSREILKGLVGAAPLWAEVNAMLADKNESPYTKMDIIRLAHIVGRLDDANYELQLKKALREPLRNLDSKAVTVLCTLQKEHGVRLKVSSSDIDVSKLKTNNGLKAMACLQAMDLNVEAQTIGTFRVIDKTAFPDVVTSGLEAMMPFQGYSAERAAEAAKYIGSPNPTWNAHAHILAASTSSPQERRRYLASLLTLPESAQEDAYQAIARSGLKSDDLARDMIGTLSSGTENSYFLRVQAISRITPPDSPVWQELAAEVDQRGEFFAASAANYFRDIDQPPPGLMNWALGKMQQVNQKRRPYFSSLIAKMDLSAEQTAQLSSVLASNPKPEIQASLRYILRNQRDSVMTEAQRAAAQGSYAEASCGIEAGLYVCAETKF